MFGFFVDYSGVGWGMVSDEGFGTGERTLKGERRGFDQEASISSQIA